MLQTASDFRFIVHTNCCRNCSRLACGRPWAAVQALFKWAFGFRQHLREAQDAYWQVTPHSEYLGMHADLELLAAGTATAALRQQEASRYTSSAFSPSANSPSISSKDTIVRLFLAAYTSLLYSTACCTSLALRLPPKALHAWAWSVACSCTVVFFVTVQHTLCQFSGGPGACHDMLGACANFQCPSSFASLHLMSKTIPASEPIESLPQIPQGSMPPSFLPSAFFVVCGSSWNGEWPVWLCQRCLLDVAYR